MIYTWACAFIVGTVVLALSWPTGSNYDRKA